MKCYKLFQAINTLILICVYIRGYYELLIWISPDYAMWGLGITSFAISLFAQVYEINAEEAQC